MGLFDIDFVKLVKRLLPDLLVQPKTQGLLAAFVSPVVTVYGWFGNFRAANLYELRHNGQVVYLEAVLNDMFDPVSRGITIVNAEQKKPVYIYPTIQSKPVYVYPRSLNLPKYIYRRSETWQNPLDFIVQVPTGVTYDVNQMRALINKYKYPDKDYSIITI